MECFSVVLMTIAERSVEKMLRLLKERTQRLPNIRIEPAIYERFSEIRCFEEEQTKWTYSEKIKVREAIAWAVADFILQEEEEKLILHVLEKEYAYDRQEAKAVAAYCKAHPASVKDGASERMTLNYKVRGEMISRAAQYLLKERGRCNISGLLSFRLRDYRKELRETVEYAIEDYLLDKQYQEFISLLRYFVFIQKSKMPLVHLIHRSGREFTLLNEQLLPIETSIPSSAITVEAADRDYSFEDAVVSTLITVAPHQIIIHTREPDVPVITTIRQVFEERATVCSCCKLCVSHLDGSGNDRAARSLSRSGDKATAEINAGKQPIR